MSTKELIEQLSRDATGKPCLRSPGHVALRLLLVLAIYGIGVQFFLGIRGDIFAQLSRPMFALEITLLLALTLSSVLAAIVAMYPDAHQKPWILRLPHAVFIALMVFILVQLFTLQTEAGMVIPPPGGHGMECALCIASVALVPSGILFGILRKGASVCPRKAGSFAVLAAAGLGCLTLRLAEANDSLLHLASWHYLPTLLFAALGALVGRWALKW